MRLALLLPVLLGVAAPAYADGARESRYGPTTPRRAAAAVRYDGPMLGWANKRQASNPVAGAAPAGTARPAPIAAWAGYGSARAASAAPSPGTAPPATALPANLYAAPRSAPAAYAPPAVQPRPVTAVNVASTAPRPVPTAAPLAPAHGVTGARFYSVSREAGLTPDPIPPAGPARQVLISAEVPPPPPEDAAPVHGSADWLARGDDDQDGDRRAKTRNEAL